MPQRKRSERAARERETEAEVEVVRQEEEEEEERRRRPSLRGLASRLIVRCVGCEAAQHLLNAEKEILLAVRAALDDRIERMEKAAEKLRRIEVE